MISASENIKNLAKRNIELTTENKNQANEILYLKEELAQLKKMIFAGRSEGFKSETDGQLSLGLFPENQDVSKP